MMSNKNVVCNQSFGISTRNKKPKQTAYTQQHQNEKKRAIEINGNECTRPSTKWLSRKKKDEASREKQKEKKNEKEETIRQRQRKAER